MPAIISLVCSHPGGSTSYDVGNNLGQAFATHELAKEGVKQLVAAAIALEPDIEDMIEIFDDGSVAVRRVSDDRTVRLSTHDLITSGGAACIFARV